MRKTSASLEKGAFAGLYVIYNRRSTDDAQNQKNSLQYQRLRNMEFAQREHLGVADLAIDGFCVSGVIDESHSGYKEESEFELKSNGMVQYRVLRPKFLRLVELLKSRKIKGVIILCWDRASRNKQDDMLLKKLMHLGCDIRFTEANYDKTSSGELHMDIDGMFAAHYSRVISEKVRNAYVKLRSEGRCIYSAPIGYLDRGSDNKPFDPERAPIVKRIFELYASGEWSFAQLAKWAKKQGLTKKPMRRKRTTEEILDNVDPAQIEKVARPVDHKTIEYILKNPFYIGKIRVRDGYQDGRFHQPLIDQSLFWKVQSTLKSRNVSLHYVDEPFFTYRGMIHCTCGRLYSPYEQKGIVYYRSRCKTGCTNNDPNLTETDVFEAIQKVMERIHFTDEELAQFEREGKSELHCLSEKRDKELEDLHARQRKVVADLTYLTENRLTLFRTGVMTAEGLTEEEARLKRQLKGLDAEIAARSESAPAMLDFVIRFSAIVKNASEYYKHALDSERRELASDVFSELVFANRGLVKYSGHEGFGALLDRLRATGSPVCIISELYRIYPLVQLSAARMQKYGF